METVKSILKKKPPPSVSSKRLYYRYIESLKLLQALGYGLVIISCLGLIGQAFNVGTLFFLASLIFSLIMGAIACFFIYMTTEGFIALIDLLSRIEENTRKLQEQPRPATSALPKPPLPSPPVSRKSNQESK